MALEFKRNAERYAFLRWGAQAFDNLRIVPPGDGICHQINLEYLARVVWTREENGARDRVSRFAARHGQPHADDQQPRHCRLGRRRARGRRGARSASRWRCWCRRSSAAGLVGSRGAGVTATDLVLTVTQVLRRHKVVGKFVEYFGPGVDRARAARPRHDRQHDARRTARRWASSRSTPRRCATCARPGATRRRSRWSRPTPRRKGLWRDATTPDARNTRAIVEIDLASGRAERCRARAGRTSACRSRDAPRRLSRSRSSAQAPSSANAHCQGRRHRDRRHHELHQHVESVGDDRRRTCSRATPWRAA